jgi:thiamine-phosphate pyrophosphorylase
VKLPSPLYVILDRSVARGRALPELLEAVLAGGCRMVQLREKAMPVSELFPVAQVLRRRSREAGALFIVNDRADLALALDADGLHLGQDDLPGIAGRRLLRPGMILGVSTHDAGQARRALADGADYIAVGSMFPTGTKPGFQLVGPDLIRRVRPEIAIPLVAIGGITEDNCEEVVSAGADAVAVISAVCAAADPETATRRFLERLAGAASRPR